MKSSAQNSSVEVQIPGDSTKEQRTAFYALINRMGNPHLEARTINPTTIRIQLKSQAKFPPPPGRPRFWTFSLLKQEVDTMRAVQRICAGVRPQRLQARQVSYCGVKDQRGVTIQKV